MSRFLLDSAPTNHAESDIVTFLTLHGSSQDATTLADFAREVAPGARLIAPRGIFPDESGYTFVLRHRDRGIVATEVMVHAEYWLSRNAGLLPPMQERLFVAGYSSGAIFAEALLSVTPDRFAGAVLIRPEPLASEFSFPEMPDKPILVLAGRYDERRRSDDASRLVAQLEAAGAKVALHILDTGHGWAHHGEDVTLARDWMAGVGIA